MTSWNDFWKQPPPSLIDESLESSAKRVDTPEREIQDSDPL